MPNTKKATVLGGTTIVAGTMIGAGMLTLPLISSGMWFGWAIIIMLATFTLMYFSAEMILEVNLNYQPGASFDTLVKDNLGTFWAIINGLAVSFVLYILIYAYISGSSGIISDTFNNLLGSADQASAKEVKEGFNSQQAFFALIYAFVFATVVWISTKTVDRFSTILVAGMLITFFAAVSGLIGNIKIDFLFSPSGESRYAIFALGSLPFFLTSFCFHASVPSLVKYFGVNAKSIRKCIFFGMSITFVFYFLWILACFGNIERTSFTNPYANVDVLLQLLRNTGVGQILNYATSIFTFFAILTSFLGAGLGLFDYIADLFKFADDRLGRLKTAVITFLPPTIGGIFFPDGFVRAIGYAGFAAAIWSVIVPALLVLTYRKKQKATLGHNYKPSFTVRGGSFLAFIVLAYGITTAICHMLVEVFKVLSLSSFG